MFDNNNYSDFSLVLASSVHDMKNSLGMLLSSLEGVIGDLPAQNEQQAKHIATLQYEASRINGELIQLLSIYRMQQQRLPVHIEEHYPIELFEDQLARNHMLFETRGIAVELVCDESLSWCFDDDMVAGVIHNILVNCARYTREKIQLSAQLIDKSLCLSVADDGDGYPDVMLKAPEYYVDTASVNEGCTHLGLYFASQVAALHCQDNVRGRIELSNNGPLGGGCFKLYLP